MTSLQPFLWIAFATTVAAQDGDDGGDGDSTNAIQYAHAIIASAAWVFFFPLGAILLRLIRSPSAVWVHAGVQVFSAALLIASVVTGIMLAQDTDQLDDYHPIIGLVLFACVWLQIAGGIIHHLLFKKHHRRTFVSQLHIWLGRILITLGMINGGLGMMLSDDASTGEYIAYGVVAGVMWLLFVAVSLYGAKQRSKEDKEAIDRLPEGKK